MHRKSRLILLRVRWILLDICTFAAVRLQTGPCGGTIATVVGASDMDIIEKLAGALEGREEVLEAYVFGSVARGEAAAHSDVDVAVYVREDMIENDTGFGYASQVASDLMKALGSNEVDVVVLNGAPPLLYHRVLRDGVRIISRDLAATTTREGHALSRYCDFAVQLRKIREVFDGRMGRGEFGT